MDTLEAIFTRRSSRKFTSQNIDKDTVEKILRAAMSAPSACNGQPWHFIVIDDKKVLQKLVQVHPYAKMCQEAPLAIITCAEPDLAEYKGTFFPQDLAAATENILLAARALGLGAVWVGVYPKEDRVLNLRKIFNLPPNIIPFNIIPIGFTTVEQVELDERYQVEHIHYNSW